MDRTAGVRSSGLGRVALVVECAAAPVLFAGAVAGLAVPLWLPIALLAALLATVGVGVFLHQSGVFARPIRRGPPDRPLVALTFDDGPHPIHTRKILDLLEARGHRATFFVIGARADAAPELTAEIARRGHGLGNHSFDHAWSTPLRSPSRLARELARTQEILARAAGGAPRFFRPPVGLISPPVAEAARRAGLEIVGWSGSARDGVARTDGKRALANLLPRLAPGAILVLHDAPEGGGDARAPVAPEVLPELLTALEQRGLRSVRLDDLLGYTSATP